MSVKCAIAGAFELARQSALLFLGLAAGLGGPAHAAIDLRNATIEKLGNGLTVLLLEDRRFPVASVQMLYRVGARDEVTGRTGLAHFLEHMAFRDSESFPGTALVGRIYAVGGEWHGYTWIDQTTYFATVPKDHLDLLLRIEADRMVRLKLREDDMEAERGAVLAEMHMYENLPSSMLIDAVNFTSFLAHPYRNNTIGWESDIEKLEHRDVVEFYENHYHPSNAVLAVVGDIDAAVVRGRIVELFAELPHRVATPVPRTEEPVQDGLRRITVHGDAGTPQFRIAYRAPAANSPEYPAFVVLQAVAGKSSGVNFLQNDWGTPVAENDPLASAADGVTTWYPPSAQDYVFIIGGLASAEAETAEVEAAVEARVADLRNLVVSEATLDAAISEVLDALVFDVETTEDAAHQLAFFDGLGALDTLLDLPAHVRGVTAGDVRSVARRYLRPERRTIAWYLPGNGTTPMAPQAVSAMDEPTPVAPPGRVPLPGPTTLSLDGGLPVILQPSDMSSAVQVRVVYAPETIAGASPNDPVPGYSSRTNSVRPEDLQSAIDAAASFRAEPDSPAASAADPAARLEQEFERLVSPPGVAARAPGPALVAIAGKMDIDAVRRRLEATFSGQRPAALPEMTRPLPDGAVSVHLGRPLAQAQLGYIVAAPGPRDPGADAWRLLLYILSHDYEGRLGKKAIADAGLAYYIDSRYRSDGTNAWVTLSTGVDPEKLGALQALFTAELERLARNPPTEAEVAEAKQHMLGRYVSAAQSNSEITARLATEWLWYGELLTYDALEGRLESVRRSDVVDAVGPFTRGIAITVSE